MNELGLYQELSEIRTEAFNTSQALDELYGFISNHPVEAPTTIWVLKQASESFKRLHIRLGSLSNGPPDTDP